MNLLNKLTTFILISQCILLSLSMSSIANAFELTSEGTMSSIVIPAANSAEALQLAADTTNAYIDRNYELMPFKTDASIAIDDTDEVSEDYEYEQVQIAEKQIEIEYQKAEPGLLANAIRSHLPPKVTDFIDSSATEIMKGFAALESASQEAVQIVFGQLEETFKLVSASMDSISYEITRHMESYTAKNVGFDPNGTPIGDFHTSDLHSVSHISISEHE